VSNNTIYIGGVAIGVDGNGNLTTGGTVVGSTAAWANITGKPTFATVATSGAYADLSGKPTIPTLTSISSNIIPDDTYTRYFGSDAKRWAQIYTLNVDMMGQLTVGGNAGSAGQLLQSNGGAYVPSWTSDIKVNKIQNENDIQIEINLSDSTKRIWRFSDGGALTFPDGTNQTTAWTGSTTVSSLVNGAHTLSLGSTGTTTFPGGYLKVVPNGANPYIGNNTFADLGGGDSQSTVSAISINQSVADNAGINIDTSVTNSLSGGTYLAAGSSMNVNGTRIVLGQYTVNSLGGGGPNLFTQNKIEINNNAILIGPYSSNTVDGNTVTAFTGWTFSSTGTLTLPATGKISNSTHDWTFGTDGDLIIPGDIKSEGAINIDINLSDSTLRRWRFGEDGDTVFPNNISIDYGGGNNILYPRIIADSGKAFSVQGQGETGSAALAWSVDPESAGQYAQIGATKGGGDNLAKVVIQAQSNSGDGNTAKIWKFDETGALTIPGDIRSEGNINIDINLSDSTLRRWQFGEDGELTLPAGGNISEGGGFTGAIRLTPAGGANANQALLIYPTAGAPDGDHIHLTAGGGTTELYLGNDTHYVKLVNGGNVELRAATANLSSQAAWTFETDGELDTIRPLGIKVPNGVPTDVAVINSSSVNWMSNPMSNLATTGGSGSGLRVNVNSLSDAADVISIATPGTGYLNGDLITVTSGSSNATFTIVIGGRNTWTFGTGGALTIPGDIRSEGAVNIDINLSDSTLRRWRFGEDGILTVPGPISGLGNDKLEFTANSGAVFSGSNGNTISIYANDGDIGSSADINIYTDTAGSSYKWTFGMDGALTIPGDIKSENAINIDINLSDSTLRRWRFGEDGDLETPGGIQVAGILKIDDGVHEKLQTKADATGTVTHDCSLGHIFYHTSPDANWTANFLNLNLSSGYATSVTLVIEQGATGYYPSAVRINYMVHNIKWQGNSTPTPSTNRTDVVTFSIICTATDTYTVLGQLTGF
jgi:hypothetical protein